MSEPKPYATRVVPNTRPVEVVTFWEGIHERHSVVAWTVELKIAPDGEADVWYGARPVTYEDDLEHATYCLEERLLDGSTQWVFFGDRTFTDWDEARRYGFTERAAAKGTQAMSETPTADQKPAFASDYQRMWDLVRFQRGALLDAGLITREEYAILSAEETKDRPGQGSPSPRRLEHYDELRAQLATTEAANERLAALGTKWQHRAEAHAAQLRTVGQALRELRDRGGVLDAALPELDALLTTLEQDRNERHTAS